MAYTSNISSVVKLTQDQLNKVGNPDQLLRTLAATMLGLIRVRVHRDGLASDGQRIGTYSKGYMTVRTGNYKNADKYGKGKNKGQNKNAGIYTKRGTTRFTQEDEEKITAKRGFVNTAFEKKARPNHHLPADTKVIGALTGQMQNDEKIIELQDGYGIGFTNDANYDKSQWLEETYDKPIWALTGEEEAVVDDVVNDFLDKTFLQ